jgi:hypothetical protein
MAIVTYNSVAISNARITRFSVENEYEGGAFNRTGKKCTLEGVGVIKETGTFTKFAELKNTLNTPRKSLVLKWDDGSNFTLSDDTVDARNGPLPTVNINEIHGGNVASYVVGFTFVFYDCGTTPIQRFECIQRHTIDERGYLRINRSGSLTISPQATGTTPLTFANVSATEQNPYVGPQTTYNAGPNPDFYRRLVAGFLPYGFQRTKQEYYVDASLRTLVFDVEDKQLQWNLPKPVFDGDASFDYERSLDNMLGTKTFKVSFEAAFVDKFELLTACIDTAMTRINFVGTNPDIIQSFKIGEPSIFKGNMVTFEVVAMGFPTNTEANNLGNNIDANLKSMLFGSPYLPEQPTGQAFPDAYGGNLFEVAKASVSRTALLRYDPCTAGSGLASFMGETNITVNVIAGTPSEGQTRQDDELPVNAPATDGDSETRDSAARTVRWSSKQTITQTTGLTMLEAMGGYNQYSFQMRLPQVIVVQSVEAVTTGPNAPIPWPRMDEGAIVLDMTMSVNDAPPDASGNRLYMISATRTLQVNVPLSQNTTNETLGGVSLTGDGGTLVRAWTPTEIQGPRTPFGTAQTYNLRQNYNGDPEPQTYYNRR